MATRTRRQRRAAHPVTSNVQAVGNRTELIDPSQPAMPRRVGGRPSRLTPEIEKRFIDCMKAGNYATVCARFVGLSPITVEKWIKRGRGNDPRRPPTAEYIRFARLVDEARATAEVIVVGNLVARTKTDTRAAEVWLRADAERRQRWRFLASDEDEAPPAAPPPQAPTVYDQRQQQIVVISPDQIPDIVRQALADQREQRAARLAAMPQIEPETHHNGHRIARLDGLRADEGESPLDDD